MERSEVEACKACGLKHRGREGAMRVTRGLGVECPLCGKTLDGAGNWCLSCKAQWARGHRPRHSELSDVQRMKANARSYVNVYIRRGKLTRGPCERCGSRKAQMHHDDYSKPLAVRWLCRKCHLALHAEESSKN